MMKYLTIILSLTMIFSVSCKEKKKKMVDLDQFNFDGSNNDKYLFRNEIKKEQFKKIRYKKENF